MSTAAEDCTFRSRASYGRRPHDGVLLHCPLPLNFFFLSLYRYKVDRQTQCSPSPTSVNGIHVLSLLNQSLGRTVATDTTEIDCHWLIDTIADSRRKKVRRRAPIRRQAKLKSVVGYGRRALSLSLEEQVSVDE